MLASPKEYLSRGYDSLQLTDALCLINVFACAFAFTWEGSFTRRTPWNSMGSSTGVHLKQDPRTEDFTQPLICHLHAALLAPNTYLVSVQTATFDDASEIKIWTAASNTLN